MKKSKKKKSNYNLLIGLFVTIFLVIILFILNNKNNNINNKIAKLDEIDKEILLLEKNYSILSEIDKKIDNINNSNNLINKDINNLTVSIKDLNLKIAKYEK